MPPRMTRAVEDRPAAPDLSAVPDAQLLALFARGEGHLSGLAFATLVCRHGPMVLGVCRRVLADPHAADDAFQSTFLVLARKAGSIRRPERLGPWLYGVALRSARQASRRERRESHDGTIPLEDLVGDEGWLEHRLARAEECRVLHEEVGRLPDKYRVPIVLCHLEGLSHRQAAKQLRWPPGTVAVRLSRAREILRDRLTRRGLAPSVALMALAGLPETAAAVPPGLHDASVCEGLRLAADASAPIGIASAPAPALCGHIVGSLWMANRLLRAAVLVLAVGLAVIGAAKFPPEADALAGSDVGVEPVAVDSRRPSSPVDHAALVTIREPVSKRTVRQVSSTEPRETDRHRVDARRSDAASSASLPQTLAAYRALATRAGHTADDQVGLALWCEARGLESERAKHLALALLVDPTCASARGLLGQVAYQGRWLRSPAVAERVNADTGLAAALAEYHARRARLEPNAESHWKLALWCEGRGLLDEATAHVTAVTRLEPHREAAWRRLGCKVWNGRWLRPEQIAFEKEKVEAQKKADRLWRPMLAKWKAALRDENRRGWAESQLASVADPLAVPAIWTTFAQGGPADQARAVRLLSQVDGPAASRALALLAGRSEAAEVRRAATDLVSLRDPRETVRLLISLFIKPITYEVRPVGGPEAPGVLFVDGERFNVRRLYTVPSLPENTIRRLINPTTPPERLEYLAEFIGEDLTRLMVGGAGPLVFRTNVFGVASNLARAAQATVVAQQQLLADIARLESYNAVVRRANERVALPLRALTGQEFGHEPDAWHAWWTDQQGFAYNPPTARPKPTLDWEIPLPYDPGYIQNVGSTSCFAAGTPVQTREGPRPIESIRSGDVVLTQDTATGGLAFAPVLAVAHNKPAQTLHLEFGGTTIEVTGIHRFWKTSEGWVMARDLKPGDLIRTLGGSEYVVAISPGRLQPVFNLEVGPNRSFFAGQTRALVHDNSLVQPTGHPFDSIPAWLTAAANGREGGASDR